MTAAALPLPADEAAAAPPAERTHNRFLDFVRTVAILRVLAWHTYGYAWLSYLVASMPAMFFVAGALMAQSLQRGSAPRVLKSRFRRLLIPLWAFGVVALGIMFFHAAARPDPGESVAWRQPLFWVFPIWDPQGSEWGITFWAVLWYMRCLTWLILISPVLYWLFQRLSLALIGLPLGFLVVFEQRARDGRPAPWQFEDLALFGIFWLLGFAYNAGMLAGLSSRARAALALVFAGAAAVWVTTQDVPDWVVNASYPAHLLVGLTWLFIALAVEKPISRFASRGVAGWLVGWVNDRSYTIYLWHAAGLFAMYQILWVEERPGWVRDVFALPIVLAVTFTCMIAFGWIEDLAARRDPHLAPRTNRAQTAGPNRRRATWAMPLVAGLGMAALFSAVLGQVFRPPAPGADVASAVPPSGVGISIRASRAHVLDRPPERAPSIVDTAELPPIAPADLQQLIDRWRQDYSLEGVLLGVQRADGARWMGASGIDPAEGAPLTAAFIYPTASVTKTFTAALILQLAEEGKLDLDAKASQYAPGIAHSSEYTVRQLIQHTSGLMSTDAVAPADALYAATQEDLAFQPGTGFLYSSPGYFMLGLIIEKVTGASYTQTLRERLLEPLGLTQTFMDEELAPLDYSTHPITNPALRSSSGVQRSGSRLGAAPAFEYHGILWSSAGIHSTVGDLAAWAMDLWDSSAVVSPQTRDQMTTFLGVEFQYAGLATYPFCPCWLEQGKLKAEQWGHYGRFGLLEYDPRDRIAVAIYTSGTDIDERMIVAYDDLSARVRDLLRGRRLEQPPPLGP